MDRFGKPVYIDQKPPTVTGLALALGFSGRQSLLNYQSKAEFVDTIMRAKSRVEEYTEQRLFDRDGSDGAKFSLRNNFRGWDDKPQSEMDQEEQRIRIEHMQAQVEQIRAQTAKIKAQTGEGEEIADDGFLEALKGAAAEDWSGENYSKRIWRNTKELAQTVKEEQLVNLLTGRTDREAAEIITYRFASGASKARRLVRTESNFISSELNHEAYKESGVAEYQYLATLDLRTSKICQELDKKIFKVSERKVGVNCNPMHPWCRSTTVAVIDREFLDMGMRSARDPKTGKTIKVPASMNYKEWYEKFVGGKDEAKLAEKKLKNKSADKSQHEKYAQEIKHKASGGKQYVPYDLNDKKDVAAANEYKKISKRDDARKIAESSGMTVDEIRQIKRHIFYNKHKTYVGYKNLYPDYDMAVAWKRLYEGCPEERDILLLKHELLESNLEKEYNLTISEAHAKATEKFDWAGKLEKDLGGEGEKYGIL